MRLKKLDQAREEALSMSETKESKSINEAIVHMQEALLGVAEVEEGVLKNIKNHLDKLLDNIYAHVKDLKNIAALDAMLVETPMSQADPALRQGLDGISSELNAKNAEIIRLQQRLASLGVDVPKHLTGQSVEMLRQHLDELNKRNRQLKQIHRKLAQHPIISGKIPKSITFKEARQMLEKLNEQIKILNKTNYEMRKQIRPQENKLDTDNRPAGPKGPR